MGLAPAEMILIVVGPVVPNAGTLAGNENVEPVAPSTKAGPALALSANVVLLATTAFGAPAPPPQEASARAASTTKNSFLR